MPEREPQTQEQVNIHERGGLTQAHWQEILRAVPRDSKVARYARFVIEGSINEVDFAHRQYLGHRHWVLIDNSVVKHSRGVHVVLQKFYPHRQRLMQEVRDYVSREVNVSYTIADFLEEEQQEILRGKNRVLEYTGGMTLEDQIAGRSSGIYYYSWNGKNWVVHGWSESLVDYYGQMQGGDYTDKVEGSNRTILSAWLLIDEEVPDVSNKSPQELTYIAKNHVPVEILNERLKSYLKNKKRKQFKLVGGWEKEI